MMDIIKHQSNGGADTRTLDVILARLVPHSTLEENLRSYYVEKKDIISLQRMYVEDIISLGCYNKPIGRGSGTI
jgi:hypothetical protein